MKRFLLLCALVLAHLSAYSQSAEPSHLEFKSIPLIGNYKAFAQKLVAQGCEIISTDENLAILKGSFVSKECSIGVAATNTSKTVWKVLAILPNHDTWRTLKLEYDNLKAQYGEKYGTPYNVEESVSESYLEGNEWAALTLGKCTYRTVWYMDTGAITIEMTEDHNIMIHYEDGVGMGLKDKETQSDI